VVSDGHCIGSDGGYFGDNDAQLGSANVLYHEAVGGKYVRAPRGALRPLARRDRHCARVSARRALPPGKPRDLKHGRGKQLGRGPPHKGRARILMTPPL
jgi:hypothetical protein